jgi:hypothetical protein
VNASYNYCSPHANGTAHPPSNTHRSYWNYLRRQLFVLDTYWAPADRCVLCVCVCVCVCVRVLGRGAP